MSLPIESHGSLNNISSFFYWYSWNICTMSISCSSSSFLNTLLFVVRMRYSLSPSWLLSLYPYTHSVWQASLLSLSILSFFFTLHMDLQIYASSALLLPLHQTNLPLLPPLNHPATLLILFSPRLDHQPLLHQPFLSHRHPFFPSLLLCFFQSSSFDSAFLCSPSSSTPFLPSFLHASLSFSLLSIIILSSFSFFFTQIRNLHASPLPFLFVLLCFFTESTILASICLPSPSLSNTPSPPFQSTFKEWLSLSPPS